MKCGWPQSWPFTDFWVRQKKLCSFFYRQSPARNPLKKRSDHSFYHRQTRNTRKQWTKNAPRASSLDRKRYESTQSAREDRPTSVGVVEAAHSSRVTQTISSVHNRPEGLVWTLDCFLPEILFFIVKQCESFGCFCSDTLRHNYIQSYNAKRFPEIFSGNLFLCLLHIRF